MFGSMSYKEMIELKQSYMTTWGDILYVMKERGKDTNTSVEKKNLNSGSKVLFLAK